MEFKFDEDQFEKLADKISPVRKASLVGSFIKVSPALAAVGAALWTLILYFDTERERNRLENDRLQQELLSGDVERAKLENEVAMQAAQIELDSLSWRERSATLSATLISEAPEGCVYDIDYLVVLKNSAKFPTKVDYNMVSVYRGVFTTNPRDFMAAIPPNWLTYKSSEDDAILWTRVQCFFNKTESSDIDVERIYSEYSPDVAGLEGTGQIMPGDILKLGYSFYMKAQPEDWVAVVYHGSFDEGSNWDDDKTFIEWKQFSEIARSNTQQDGTHQPLSTTPNQKLNDN